MASLTRTPSDAQTIGAPVPTEIMPPTPIPLCVDLDGTLVRTDVLVESVLALVKRNPLYVLMLPAWLARGRAALKAEVARRVELDPAALPYRDDFLAWLRGQRQEGRRLVLATSANARFADAIARHVGLFDSVVASDEHENLSGRRKAARLVQAYGERGFDYCGNEAVDLAVWKHASGAVVVGGERLARRAGRVSAVRARFADAAGGLRVVARACRAHQWVKNVLLFVPLLAAHRANDLQAGSRAALGFFAFCLCASSVYLLNDLFDLQADRAHPRKRLRPIASGAMAPLTGLALAPALLFAAGAMALALPGRFEALLASYFLLALWYSLTLKRLVLVDVLTLVGLYTVRIVAGAEAVGVPLSFWLLLFSIFLFLSLAIVKRYAELDGLRGRGELAAAGRGYVVQDLQMLQSFGVASGYLSALVLGLYIDNPEVTMLYRHPRLIWGLCVILLYWVSRVWLTAHRGQMHDDPLVFAVSDRQSLALGVAAAALVLLAT